MSYAGVAGGSIASLSSFEGVGGGSLRSVPSITVAEAEAAEEVSRVTVEKDVVQSEEHVGQAEVEEAKDEVVGEAAVERKAEVVGGEVEVVVGEVEVVEPTKAEVVGGEAAVVVGEVEVAEVVGGALGLSDIGGRSIAPGSASSLAEDPRVMLSSNPEYASNIDIQLELDDMMMVSGMWDDEYGL